MSMERKEPSIQTGGLAADADDASAVSMDDVKPTTGGVAPEQHSPASRPLILQDAHKIERV